MVYIKEGMPGEVCPGFRTDEKRRDVREGTGDGWRLRSVPVVLSVGSGAGVWKVCMVF